MESVTSSLKARAKTGKIRVLLDPLMLLFLAFLFAGLVFLGDLSRRPLNGFQHGQGQGMAEIPADARAFLFFEKADINRLDLEGLILIPGIGQGTAQKIMNYRDDFGFILDLDELLLPQGPLGWKRLEILKQYCRT